MPSPAPTQQAPRLKFIDLARAIAIMLMLEGHFVTLTLGESYRDSSHPVYQVWHFFRGFTAPLFFTVAGMIFIYLLGGDTEANFLKRKRVRKGLIRSAELLLWGYALQFSLAHVGSYSRLDFEDWVFAFHILQCIGIGLLALLVIAALQHRFSKIPLAWWYAAAGIIVLSIYCWLGQIPKTEAIPKGWPQIFQNAIQGPRSQFPLAPWLAYAFLGAMIGDCLRRFYVRLQTPQSCLWFLAFAAFFIIVWALVSIIPGLDAVTSERMKWFPWRAAQVVAFLGLLRCVEMLWGMNIPRVLCVGTLTFEIYIIHVIILYGGITGLGLDNWLEKQLTPWQAAGGAAIFLLFFFLLAQAIVAVRKRRRA